MQLRRRRENYKSELQKAIRSHNTTREAIAWDTWTKWRVIASIARNLAAANAHNNRINGYRICNAKIVQINASINLGVLRQLTVTNAYEAEDMISTQVKNQYLHSAGIATG